MRSFLLFALVFGAVGEIAKKHVEPSFLALAKAKAAKGQKSGVAGIGGDDKPKEAVMVDVFDLVISNQRNERREVLFARDNVRTANHYGKIPKNLIAKLNDKAYISAFRTVLQRIIKPTSIVLHSSCHVGLISMMAARMGAYKVYALEGNKVLADIAQKVIEDNGLSDRIVVLHKNISDLTAADMPYKADIYINERITNLMMASLMPFEMSLVKGHFLKDEGIMVPEMAQLFAFFIESAEIRKGVRVTGPVAGFDFSRLNGLAASALMMQTTNLHNFKFRALGEVMPTFVWNAWELKDLPFYFQIDISIASHGILDAVVFYWDCWLDKHTKLTTNPSRGKLHDHMGVIKVHITPRHVKAEDFVTVLVGVNNGLLQADVIKINGVEVKIPDVPTSTEAL